MKTKNERFVNSLHYVANLIANRHEASHGQNEQKAVEYKYLIQFD